MLKQENEKLKNINFQWENYLNFKEEQSDKMHLDDNNSNNDHDNDTCTEYNNDDDLLNELDKLSTNNFRFSSWLKLLFIIINSYYTND